MGTMKITVDKDDMSTSIEIPRHASSADLAQAFRTIMFSLTYSESVIDDVIPDQYRDWSYADDSIEDEAYT